MPHFNITSSEHLGHLLWMPDVLVNCTPIGMNPDDVVPEWMDYLLKWMNPQGTFFDMVYSRTGRTLLSHEAARRFRLNCVSGEDMLIEQAALSFQFWTGKEGAAKPMREALRVSKSVTTAKS